MIHKQKQIDKISSNKHSEYLQTLKVKTLDDF